jgi:hypothetical protein
MKKKNIFLLGTCRIRNIYCHINKSEIKYNFINYDQDFIGRTYSLIDTYELLKCIITNNKNINSHEFRSNTNLFKQRINNMKLSNIDLFVIEISSLKYYTHFYENNDSKILFSPNFGKTRSLSKYKLNILTEKEMDYYFNKIIELLFNKKILFVFHLKSDIIPNRMLIKNNLIKNINKTNKTNKNNIMFIQPEKLLNTDTDNVDKYLDDDNHYNTEGYKIISLEFLKLFDIYTCGY